MIEYLDSLDPFPVQKIKDELSHFPSGLVLIDRAVSDSLGESFSPFFVKVVEGGEALKTLSFAETLFEEMSELGLNRHSFVLALGGGALLDLAGFVAACFMRGIPFFSVPTTLLAQVDAAYGGKTAVNLKSGKNLVGAFHPAQKIWIYSPFVKTQDPRSFRSGFAEVIKYGVIDDPQLFEFLEENTDSLLNFKNLEFVIRRSLEIKKKFVLSDPKEKGMRAQLNFGHTIGHAIEAFTGYKKYLHGEAVAIGMCLEAQIAVERGLFSEKEFLKLLSLCQSFKLFTNLNSTTPFLTELLPFLKKDKKNREETIGFILPRALGKVELHQIML